MILPFINLTGQINRAQNETQEVSSVHWGTLIYCKGDQALAQTAQEGCGVSVPGDFKKPSAHSPGQPVLDDPA